MATSLLASIFKQPRFLIASARVPTRRFFCSNFARNYCHSGGGGDDEGKSFAALIPSDSPLRCRCPCRIYDGFLPGEMAGRPSQGLKEANRSVDSASPRAAMGMGMEMTAPRRSSWDAKETHDSPDVPGLGKEDVDILQEDRIIGNNTSSSSSTESACDGLRYVNKNCRCGIKAIIKVAESGRNKGRSYYACANGVCDCLEWCCPTAVLDTVGTEINSNNLIPTQRPELIQIKHDLQKVQDYNLFLSLLVAMFLGAFCPQLILSIIGMIMAIAIVGIIWMA